MLFLLAALLTHPLSTIHSGAQQIFAKHSQNENSVIALSVPDSQGYLSPYTPASSDTPNDATYLYPHGIEDIKKHAVELAVLDTASKNKKVSADQKKTVLTSAPQKKGRALAVATTIPSFLHVPFFSQFKDIASPKWQKVGCGVTSLAMMIEYYKPGTVLVDTLLKQGVKAGAYLEDAGWTYDGLIALSQKYGLDGNSYDLGGSTSAVAFSKMKETLRGGPVIASVHYKFDPNSRIPHLVVINGIKNDTLYYNDPAAKTGGKQISTEDFLKGWKKRFIVVRPA